MITSRKNQHDTKQHEHSQNRFHDKGTVIPISAIFKAF